MSFTGSYTEAKPEYPPTWHAFTRKPISWVISCRYRQVEGSEIHRVTFEQSFPSSEEFSKLIYAVFACLFVFSVVVVVVASCCFSVLQCRQCHKDTFKLSGWGKLDYY